MAIAQAALIHAAQAQESSEPQLERGDWEFQLDGGIARLAQYPGRSATVAVTAASVGLRLARRVDPAWYLGLSLDGVGRGASGRALVPGTGIGYGPNYSGGWGIEQVLVFAGWHAAPASPWFLQAGGGWSRFWSTRAGESAGVGTAIEAAAGYEIPIRAATCRCSLAPFIAVSAGRIGRAETPPGIWQGIDYRAVSVALALKLDR